MTSQEVKAALLKRHPSPEWARFDELRDSAGFAAQRSFDLWVMNTWPSKGLKSVVYEIKVSRGDFMKEIKNPKKRESAEGLSNEAYFAAPTGLLKEHEIPEGWGLVEVSESGTTRARKLATQRKGLDFFDPHFVAALLRRAAEKESFYDKQAVEIEGMRIAASDWRRFLNQKVTELFEIRKPVLTSEAIRLAENELRESYAGSKQALDELLKMLREAGWPHRAGMTSIPEAVKVVLERVKGERFGDELQELQSVCLEIERLSRSSLDRALALSRRLPDRTADKSS